MRKTKRDITILSIGDRPDYDECNKFNHEGATLKKRGFEYETVQYKNALKGRFPEIKTKKVIIFLFFPFDYWNKNIECRGYKGIYGNRVFFKKFMYFWRRINDIIKRHFCNNELIIINNPLLSGKYRDKQLIKLKLSKAGIRNPKLYRIISVRDIDNLLAKGKSLFLKSRYGSMGKGITYLSPLNWQTNFNIKDNRIISRRSDYGWRFRDITGNNLFLSKLIKNNILVEEAIDSLILKRKRIDLRIYTFFNKVIYIYPKTNYPGKITTNIYKGGRGSPYILQFVPKKLINKTKTAAVKAAKILKLCLAGIDIVLDRNLKNVYIVDVNVFPGFPKRKTFNLTRRIVKELAYLDNRKDLRFEKGCNI